MELLVVLGVVLEQLAGLKLLTQHIAIAVHLIHQLGHAIRVRKPEGTAAEGRETNAEDGSNV